MHTVRSQFDSLLDRLHSGEASAAKKIQELRPLMDPKTFRALLSEGFATREAADGVRLADLFDIRDLAQMLLETYLESKERALLIGAKLAASDPRFDAALLECLREVSAGSSDDALLVGLEILDAISERDRLVLNVLRLLKDPNPKLRSKAALFIARRRPQLRWVSDLSQEMDARVRANTLESLFGINEPFILPLFRQHVNDANNRVAGNAIFGLYQAGETASITLLDQMAKDERPEFRNTAVWVMGQTGDPRFSNVLAAQLSDTDKLVRRQALLGLGRIKQMFKTARERSPLHLRSFSHFVKDGQEHLTIAVSTEFGEAVGGVSGTRFLVKAGTSFIRDYKAQECDSKIPMSIAYIECLPQRKEDAATTRLDGFEDQLLQLRRAKDKVTFSQLSYEAQLGCRSETEMDFATVAATELKDFELNAPNLHLVLVATTRETHIAEKVLEWAATVHATVHLIAVAPEWQSPELLERINVAGGLAILADIPEFGRSCTKLHMALLHHYRLEWPSVEGGVELEVRGEAGTGTCSFSERPKAGSSELPETDHERAA